MTTTVDISTLQGINELLSLLEVDNELILTQANTPIAKLASMNHAQVPPNGRVPNLQPDIWISNNFDEPLPERFWNDRTL